MRACLSLGVGALVFCLGTHAWAAPINLQDATLADLLGEGYTQATAVRVTPLTAQTFTADVYSQAYQNAAGDTYAYLYQVANTSLTRATVEMFTLDSFSGADDNSIAGVISDTGPAGFLSLPSRAPESQADIDSEQGPVVSFYFIRRDGFAINEGQHSSVMYVVSHLKPGEIRANVIDGSVATGGVVGPVASYPVPEPAALTLSAVGALLALRRTRR